MNDSGLSLEGWVMHEASEAYMAGRFPETLDLSEAASAELGWEPGRTVYTVAGPLKVRVAAPGVLAGVSFRLLEPTVVRSWSR